MSVAVVSVVDALVGMTGVVCVAVVVVLWITDFALFLAVGAVLMVGVGLEGGGDGRGGRGRGRGCCFYHCCSWS